MGRNGGQEAVDEGEGFILFVENLRISTFDYCLLSCQGHLTPSSSQVGKRTPRPFQCRYIDHTLEVCNEPLLQ